MIEKAFKFNIFDLEKSSKLLKDYDTIYYGPEFCENLLPLYFRYFDKINFDKKKIVFVIPILTDKGIKDIKDFFKNFNSSFDFEITVNDFGAIKLLKELKLDKKINIGRHLSKHIFILEKNYITITSTSTIDFLKKLDINSYEISNFIFSKDNLKIDSRINELDINFNIYYPYVLLSTTRTCLLGTNDIMPEESIKEIKCQNECGCGIWEVKTDKIKERLFVIENSTFVINEKKYFLNFNKLKRVVYY